MTEYILNGNPEKCCGCRACEHICPKNAISMYDDSEGFLYPVLDDELCIKCGLCAKTCPLENYSERGTAKVAYAAQYKKHDTLMDSSSGGIFSAAADYMISKGGAVAGCIFDNNIKAIHVVTEDENIIEKMRGSKYVQSDTLDTYKDTKQRLDKGQLVLYTGTPCQIDGLLHYLGKEYDNLLTIDLICHGVPSPHLLELYLDETSLKKGKITDVKFRDKKRNGWGSRGYIQIENGEKRMLGFKISPFNSSYYQYYYLKNSVSRMCCYSCQYANVNRVSDITIGDYWNITDIMPKLDSSKGISVLLANNAKGENFLEEIKDKLVLHKTGISSAVAGNGNLSHPSAFPESRKNIYKRINERGYAAVAAQDCKYSYVVPFIKRHIPRWVKNFIKNVVRTIKRR